jgi:colanic acid/amylovoran biosynthesis glycosyltransferase
MTIIFLAHNCNMTFINTELRFLLGSDKVKEVRVFTDFPIEDLEVAFHDKCQVFVFGGSAKKALGLPILGIIVKEIMSHGFWYLKRKKWKELFLYSRDHMKKARFILDQGIPKDAILYSFWAGSGAFIIACLKRFGIKNMALTRLHAFDIYEDGDNHGHIPWRSFVLKQLNHLITISEHGRKYLAWKYPYTQDKTRTITLGIPLKELGLNQAPETDLNIVSCSWVGTRKNLTGVFDALHNMQNTTWTHLGDGEDFEALRIHTNQPSFLKVNLPGRFSQDGIHTFYRDEKITCFISLSTNEGLPVSMMEAMAYGIPVVSSDVGGCAEIITPETGVLLPKHYTHEDVVNAVNICAEKFSSPEARKRIQEFIKANFDAELNYRKFLGFLKEENTKHMALHS